MVNDQVVPALVGRELELALLNSLIDEVRRGNSARVNIAGDAGMGKTALLDSIARCGIEAGFRVLRASGSRSEQDVSFSVLADLLDDPLREPGIVEQLDETVMADLGQVALSCRDYAGPTEQPITSSVGRAVRQVLAAVGSQTRLMVIVDDLHWTDSASSAVIGYLTRRGIGSPLFIATALRPGRYGARTNTRAGSNGELPISNVTLHELDRVAALSLLENIPSARREQVLAMARGNPFYLREFAHHSAAESAGWVGTDDHLAEPPHTVRSEIQADLTSLSVSAKRAVEAAAVMGDLFDMPEVAAVAGLDVHTAAAAESELVEARFIVATQRPGRFRFRHPVIARVVYLQLCSSDQIRLHGAIAEVLDRTGADVLRLARHLEGTAKVGDVFAIDSLVEAGNAAARFDPQTAARFYRSAIDLLPAKGELALRRSRLIRLRADCLIRRGRLDEARLELSQTLTDQAAVASDDAVMLNVALMRVEGWLGEYGGMSARAQTLLVDASRLPESDRIWVRLAALIGDFAPHDVDQVMAQAAEILQQAESLGVVRVQFGLHAWLACVCAHTGHIQAATQQLDRALKFISRLSLDEFGETLEGLVLLLIAEHWLGRFDDSLAHARFGLELAEITGSRVANVQFHLAIEMCLSAKGALASAAAVLDQAETTVRAGGPNALLAMVLARQAVIHAMRGHLGVAVGSIRELDQVMPTTSLLVERSTVDLAIAFVRYCNSDFTGARQALLRDAQGESLPFIVAVHQARAYHLLTLIELAIGDIGRADSWATCANRAADHIGLPESRSWARQAQAEVQLAAASPQRALVAARQAAVEADLAETPLVRAQAWLLQGRALAQLGRLVDAEEIVRKALHEFEQAGARVFAADAVALLGLWGVESPRRHVINSVGASALTAREREIAELVAGGGTNREIAGELYLSKRTVEAHIRKVFSKLGVRSREEVGVLIRRG